MIFILGVVVIVVLTAIAIVRSEKPINIILAEAKYEIVFYALASHCVFQDIVMRRNNKTELPNLNGKFALITGGTRGIGLQVVRLLLKCDVHVIIGCRNTQVGETILEKFRKDGITTGTIDVFQLDISSLASIRKFATTVSKKFPKLHYLINCAGILQNSYIETKDGFESLLATNYLGHFLLTHLLLPQIKAGGTETSNSRIINVSSCAYLAGDINFDDFNNTKKYISAESYAQSKLAQILFTNYLDRNFRKEDNIYVQVNSVHPGIVDTDLFEQQNFKKIVPWASKLFFKTPEQGATTVVHACVSSELEGKGGTYITNCQITNQNEKAMNEDLQDKLFEFTKTLLKIDHFGINV